MAWMGQPDRDSQNGTARTGQPERDSQNGIARIGQAKQERPKKRTANTRQDCWTEKSEKDSRDRTGWTGQPWQTAWTGQPKQDSLTEQSERQPEKKSQDCQDMTAERLWALEPGFQCMKKSKFALYSFAFGTLAISHSFSSLSCALFGFWTCDNKSAKKRWSHVCSFVHQSIQEDKFHRTVLYIRNEALGFLLFTLYTWTRYREYVHIFFPLFSNGCLIFCFKFWKKIFYICIYYVTNHPYYFCATICVLHWCQYYKAPYQYFNIFLLYSYTVCTFSSLILFPVLKETDLSRDGPKTRQKSKPNYTSQVSWGKTCTLTFVNLFTLPPTMVGTGSQKIVPCEIFT
jgi:hypothetical protein